MTIVILVKQVPDMNAVKIDASTGAASTSGKSLNSFDGFAFRHALNLRDATGGEIVAVTAGPPAAKDVLTRTLAMGADRGIHIELDDQADRDSLDMAQLFAGVIAPLNADIVLCGQQSDDIETGQLGPQLAEMLHMPHISSVMVVEPEGDRLRVRRDSEGGYQHVIAPMPVLLMVTSSAEEAPYPSIKGMMAAKRKPVEKIPAPARDGEPRLSWRKPKAPKREFEGILVQGESAQDAARQLVSWLRGKKLIAG